MSANVIIAARAQPLVVNFGPFVKTMNDEDFTKLCQLNSDLRIERTREGDLDHHAAHRGRDGPP